MYTKLEGAAADHVTTAEVVAPAQPSLFFLQRLFPPTVVKPTAALRVGKKPQPTRPKRHLYMHELSSTLLRCLK